MTILSFPSQSAMRQAVTISHSDVGGTSSQILFVMCGLGDTWLFTPKNTGNLMVFMVGQMANTTLGDFASVKGAFGSGAAPINGAAATGTLFTSTAQLEQPVGGDRIPFTCVGTIPNANPAFAIPNSLMVGQQYWFDLQQQSNGGGTMTVYFPSLMIIEL